MNRLVWGYSCIRCNIKKAVQSQNLHRFRITDYLVKSTGLN